MKLRRNARAKFVVASIVAIALAATLAFTNTNTVPGSNAGAGSGAISGYTVSAIDYNLLASDPQELTSVTFNLNGNVPSSYDTKIQLAPAGTWYDCSEGAYDSTNNVTPVTCSFAAGSEPTVVSATNLTVVVVQ
jgi:hypothetical protein